MKLAFPSPEFDDAVAAVCHGTASEAEMRALNELLRSDPRARDEYLVRIELHTRLASDPNLFAPTESAATDGRPAVINLDGWRKGRVAQAVPPGLKRRWAPVLAMAAGFILMAAGIWNFWLKPPGNRKGATTTAVAMLTRVVEADWGQNTVPARVGGALEPGWLRLESGLAQVVFYSGVRVIIEGPAELQLVSANEAVCPIGRLLAEVPPPARGFRLKTEQFNVVDLGTVFGVDAQRGRTEVHVFKGTVEVLANPAAKQTLVEGQAAAAQGKTAPRLMSANIASFKTLFEFHERSLASEAFRYEQWQFMSARLNQDPSLVVRLDFEHHSGADWTLPNTAAMNRTVADAVIVGCQRAEGRWREKQALEFHSVNDRVRLAVPDEFESLTLSAWVCVKGLDRQFNSLFMCDGFEPRTVHWLIRKDGALGLTVFGPEPGNLQIVASSPVIALNKLGTWLHVAAVVDGRNRQVIHYLNGAPVAQQALKLGPPFRIGAAELGNWNVVSDAQPAPHLIRNLSGSLDEFALFDRALSEAEIRDLYVTGKPDF